MPLPDWLHQAERGVGGDRGIDRAAAAFEDLDPDLRGERHARADHAMPRHHFRSRGKVFTGNSIDLALRELRAPECQHCD